MSDKDKKTNEVKPTTGWFVLKWILPFFGVMFVANYFFVSFALKTHSGRQTQNAYEEGLQHNSVLEQSRLKEQLGWSVGLEVKEAGFLAIEVFDKNGIPLENSEISAMLFSPVSSNQDQTLDIVKTDEGVFLASFDPDNKGQKELRLKVMQDDLLVEFRKRLIVE